MIQCYFTNAHETPENKALQMHAFGLAAEQQIESATKKQEIRTELNLM